MKDIPISANHDNQGLKMRGYRRNPPRSTRPPFVTPAPQHVIDELDASVYNSIEEVHVSQEAPWDEQGDQLLRNWVADIEKQSVLHRSRGFYLKRLYRILGITSIVAASLVFFTSNIEFSTNELSNQIGHSVFTFLNLILANLNSFLDYGPKYQQHFEFEGKYTKVGIEIHEILATDHEYRIPKDRTLGEYKEIVGNLYVSAPEV